MQQAGSKSMHRGEGGKCAVDGCWNAVTSLMTFENNGSRFPPRPTTSPPTEPLPANVIPGTKHVTCKDWSRALVRVGVEDFSKLLLFTRMLRMSWFCWKHSISFGNWMIFLSYEKLSRGLIASGTLKLWRFYMLLSPFSSPQRWDGPDLSSPPLQSSSATSLTDIQYTFTSPSTTSVHGLMLWRTDPGSPTCLHRQSETFQKITDSNLEASTHNTCVSKHEMDIKTHQKHRHNKIPIFRSVFFSCNCTVVHMFFIKYIQVFFKAF